MSEHKLADWIAPYLSDGGNSYNIPTYKIKRLMGIEKQNEILQEAVEFYADVKNWKDNDIFGYPPSIWGDSEIGGHGTTIPEESDHLTVGGRRAREALGKK